VATGTTELIDATTAAVFIPTIYSKSAIVAREQALLLANQVNRQFEKEMVMGQTLNVPGISNLSVQTKNLSANAATIYETITETNTTLTVNTWEYSAIAVESATETQVNRDLLKSYAPKQGYALALSIDDALTALATSLSNSVGTYAADLTYEDILRGVQYLDDANAPQSDRYLDISPAQKAGLMKLDHFVNGDYSSLGANANKAAKESVLGTWMGIPVSFSTNVNGSNAAGHDNLLFQKECMALVVQMKPHTRYFDDIDYFAKKVAVEQLRGQAIMRNDHGVNLKGA
jgi:hypothetical protein